MKTIFTAAITAVALLTGAGCTVMRDQQSVGSYVDDTTITTRVKSAYATNKTVDASDIKIDTYKGVVQLSGFADSQQEVAEAIRIARSTPGVKSVKDEIAVKPAK